MTAGGRRLFAREEFNPKRENRNSVCAPTPPLFHRTQKDIAMCEFPLTLIQLHRNILYQTFLMYRLWRWVSEEGLGTKSKRRMHTNGNEEKGKEGRQEKEVVPFEASSREPSVPKVFA